MTQKNDEIYAVIEDLVSMEYGVTAETYLFKSLEGAKAKLKELYENIDKDPYDMEEYEPNDYIDLWYDGWYDREHYHARIEKLKVGE